MRCDPATGLFWVIPCQRRHKALCCIWQHFFCRQYFENCSVHSCFIGYSSETTALVVKKSTDELMTKVESLEKLWPEVRYSHNPGICQEVIGFCDPNTGLFIKSSIHWPTIYKSPFTSRIGYLGGVRCFRSEESIFIVLPFFVVRVAW